MPLSASDKDFAQNFVTDNYGWALDLLDLERLRAQLVGPQRHLIAQHPTVDPGGILAVAASPAIERIGRIHRYGQSHTAQVYNLLLSGTKLLAVGSGGWGGSIDYDDMAGSLRRGYVATATDDGRPAQACRKHLGEADVDPAALQFRHHVERRAAVGDQHVQLIDARD